jgi:peroxiredoxin Q/BCP
MKLRIGDKAPNFSLSNQERNNVSSDKLLGTKYLLYFYPGDFTPGCTAQACNFRDNYSKFEKEGIQIFGISLNTVNSHNKFKNSYNLQFDLLSDSDGEVSEKFESLTSLRILGLTLFRISKRNSFLINEKGVIEKIFENVDPFTTQEV